MSSRGFVAPLGTTFWTCLALDRRRQSRSSGASLISQATAGLSQPTTFDGASLYRRGRAPGAAEITERPRVFISLHPKALVAKSPAPEHQRIALFDSHSIRSVIPRF
jgi:N-formylglutamate amidohydrolase